jgi:hypothetical protein
MISKFAAASIAALSLAAMAAPANAAVYISFDGVTDAFVDLDDGEINEIFGAQGGFASVFVQGNADTEGYGILHSTAVEVTAGSTAANLTVWITRTGLSQTLPGVFFSSTNNNNANGLTSTIEQFYSTTNQKYGGTSVGSVTKVGLGSNNLNDSFGVNLGNNYSWTQKYTITATSGAGGRSASPTALATAVPEPGTWALMIGGFAGAGAMLRSRRKVLAAV